MVAISSPERATPEIIWNLSVSDPSIDLFCFGIGFSASRLIARLAPEDWHIEGTGRTPGDRPGVATVHEFDGDVPSEAVVDALSRAKRMLISAPPSAAGDPILRGYADVLSNAGGFANEIEWIGYLSTTGVYGDTGGKMVAEDAPLNPSSDRSRYRAEAENAWLALGAAADLPVHLFRLAGIYGPGRSSFDQVRAGTARRIDFPGRKFSRIHVDDIATVLQTSMATPNPGAVYNVCDDVAASQADVITVACSMLGVEPPPLVPFEVAFETMSAMAKTFWNDDRLIDNRRIKEELGVTLAYPTYKDGLAAVLADED